ncbi:hypothetical protein XENOCAPTIV_014271 [Xenoophorus captivus]|uniref:Uncharacterized protein n=1 Tax=Xenoophorus captivus TaxID=1517983 RepID=A0ABV0RHA6_9TELE
MYSFQDFSKPRSKRSSFSLFDDPSFQASKFSSSNQAPDDSLKSPWTHWPPEPNLAHPLSCTPPSASSGKPPPRINTVQVTSLLAIPQPQWNQLPQVTTLILTIKSLTLFPRAQVPRPDSRTSTIYNSGLFTWATGESSSS